MPQPNGFADQNHAKLSGLAWFWLLAGCFSLAIFFIFKLNHAIYHVPIIDDAWMATVAKNLANGHGWTSSFGSVVPFDGHITTGPSVLLPLAGAIKIIGNSTYLPRVFSLVFNFALLGFFLYSIKDYFSRLQFFRLVTVMPLLLSMSNWNLWIASLGDITALLYLAIGCALLTRSVSQTPGLRCNVSAITSGFFLGCAILAKLVALVPVAGLLAIFALCFYRKWHLLLMTIASLSAPLLSWEIYKIISLSALPDDIQRIIAAKQQYIFLKTGSGLQNLIDAWHNQGVINYLTANTRANISSYQDAISNLFSPLPNVFMPLCGIITTVFFYCLVKRQNAHHHLLLAITACIVSYLSWAIIFGSSHYGRFLAIPLQLSLIALAILAARKPFISPMIIVFALINAVPFLAAQDNFFGRHYQWYTQHTQNHQALNQLKQHIEQHDDKFVLSCPAILTREAEYAVSDFNRVHDCNYFIGHYLSPKSSEPAGDSEQRLKLKYDFFIAVQQESTQAVAWLEPVPDFMLVTNPIANAYPNFGPSFRYQLFKQSCRDKIFEQDGYELWHCSGNTLMTLIDAAGGIVFFPELWQEQLWQAGIH